MTIGAKPASAGPTTRPHPASNVAFEGSRPAARPEPATDGHHARGPREPIASRIVAMSFLGLTLVYFLLPVFWLVVTATKPQGQIASTFGLWFADFNLFDNLGRLFAIQDGVFARWIVNSVLYAGGGALIGCLISAMTGYALAKFRFPGREGLFALVLGGVLVPSTAIALPLFLMFSSVGLVNTYWAVLLPSIANPFGVYLARIFASAAVPDELIESARLDGAGEFRAFSAVAMRLMAPSLVTIFLFQFVAIWNNFFLPMVMLQSSKLYPITLGLFNWNAQTARYPELQMAVITGSLVAVVPVIIVFLSLQRYWKAGLAAGSLK